MMEKTETELSQSMQLAKLYTDHSGRFHSKFIDIVPPPGIENMRLIYNILQDQWFLRFSRLEANMYIQEQLIIYDVIDAADGLTSYRNIPISGYGVELNVYGFIGKSEVDMLKFALELTTEELNALADKAEK
jgi:hypothetical protein